MNTWLATESRSGGNGRAAARVLVLLGAALFIEFVVVTGVVGGGLYALTGPCTLEYTPELQAGSARDRICDDSGLLWALPAASLAFVPVAAALAIWRVRSITLGLLLLVLASALTYAPLYAFVRIIESKSPTL